MCEFCSVFTKAYRVPVRNTYAADNMCEVIKGDNCKDCDGCMDKNYHFTLYKRDDAIGMGLIRKIGSVVCAPSSESILINYCPWCGEKLNKDDKYTFDKCCVEKLTETDW